MTNLQTNAPLKQYSMQASNRSAREIARLFSESEGEGDLNPAYQRSSVWTNLQRVELVKSWLMGVPIPSIVINDRIFGPWPKHFGRTEGEFSYAVIDGKQRIEAAQAWFGGELAVPASWFDPAMVENPFETEDGLYVYYTGLSTEEQRYQKFDFKLPTVEAKLSTIEEEAEIYLLLNSTGVAQDPRDLANAERVARRERSED